MSKIAKVDAHHHLWTLGSPNSPIMHTPAFDRFYGNSQGLKIEFGAETFKALAARQNVVKSVYVESHFHPAIDEVDAIQAIADAHGFPHGVIGSADLASPTLASALDRYGRNANFRGVRLSLQWDQDPLWRSGAPPGRLGDPDWRRGYAMMGERGLLTEVMILPAQLHEAAALARDMPGTTLVLGHTGLPRARDLDVWRAGMAKLADRPNVVVKISGLAMVDHHWTQASITPIVRETIALFGAERCMFASNFPVDGLHGSYDAVFDAFDAITADMPDEDRTALFHDNAVRVFRL